MSEVTPFNFENHAVRVIVLDNQPWFVVMDVCQALTIVNAADAAQRIHSDDRVKTEIPMSGFSTRTQEAWVVNESGLYELVFASNKPEARRFRRWVTSEVLPQIRKTGGYSIEMTPGEMLVAQAQRFLEQERRTAAIEAEQRYQRDQIEDLMGEQGAHRAELETLRENHDRVSALGWANLRKIRSDVEFLKRVGIKASVLARQHGVPVSRVHSTVWGEVNAWPLEIWDEAYQVLRDKFGL